MVECTVDLPRRRPARRMLFVFLAGSVAAHAAALILMPPLGLHSSPPRASMLEVVILQPEPLPAAATPPRPEPLPPSKRESARAPAKNEPRPHPPPARPAPTVVLLEPTLDDRRPFSLDTEYREPEPPAAEQKAQAPGAAPTTPSFSAGYLRNPAPRYPLAARRAGEQGTVTLRALVTRDGLPARVEVEKSSGSAHLDRAALEAVRAWRFAPARLGAEPVESWLLVPVVFRLEGAS
jgi:protein TonB